MTSGKLPVIDNEISWPIRYPSFSRNCWPSLAIPKRQYANMDIYWVKGSAHLYPQQLRHGKVSEILSPSPPSSSVPEPSSSCPLALLLESSRSLHAATIQISIISPRAILAQWQPHWQPIHHDSPLLLLIHHRLQRQLLLGISKDGYHWSKPLRSYQRLTCHL